MALTRRTALALLLVLAVSACGGGSKGSIRVAVLLPDGYEQPLEWALENVNAAGVDGKHIELVYTDPGKGNLAAEAEKIAADPSIVAVIGPATSAEVYEVANVFVAAKKPLVTPSAASSEIFRAFAPTHFVWSTVQSDVAQTQALLLTAARAGAKRVALLSGTDAYGATFFDWFGFLATELGLQVSAVERYDQSAQSCERPLAEALATAPDTLIVAPSTATTTECVVRHAHGAHLLFSDNGESATAARALGAAANGMQGLAEAPNATNGFAAAFRQRFHEAPTPWAANAYDALTLIAYGLQASHGAGGAALTKGMARVVDARGKRTGWDAASIATALAAIRAGRYPNVAGATGSLHYHKGLHTDLVSSTYAHWQLQHGAFVTLSSGSTTKHGFSTLGAVAVKRVASESRRALLPGRETVVPGRRTGLWAVLIATSSGLDDYRHQADVLAQYQLLRRNGVPDSRIILIMAGDVAAASGGVVRNHLGGPNLARAVHIDYRLDQVSASAFLAILGGRRTAATPTVVQSGPGDDIYVYIAGHGNSHGVYFGLDQPVPPPVGDYTVLVPAMLARAVDTMAAGKRYRRLLIALEACQGGVMGEALRAPNALLLSGANAVENSLSANYDTTTNTWLSDEFSYALWNGERSDPGQTLEALDRKLYLDVQGEHVTAYGPDFGDAEAVPVREFISP